MAYLDYNASVPLRSEAVSAMSEAVLFGANPSSVHSQGRAARAVIERARFEIAKHLTCRGEDLIFTSGGTEANNLAIHAAKAIGVERIIVSAIEHDAVMVPAQQTGLPVEIWPVGRNGQVDLDWLKDCLKTGCVQNTLVCLMAANNETGVIQPINAVGHMIREAGAWFHVDAVQLAGHEQFHFAESLAHFASVSAHKAGGPQGVGALIAACEAQVTPLISGGGQEKNRRGGTENVAGIAGFAAAFKAVRKNVPVCVSVKSFRDDIEKHLLADDMGIKVWGQQSPRLHNTLCLSAPGWLSEIQVIAMDLAGYAVSAGAACSSGKVKRSRVLEAMGAHQDEASCALRISLGWANTKEDADGFVKTWLDNYKSVLSKCA